MGIRDWKILLSSYNLYPKDNCTSYSIDPEFRKGMVILQKVISTIAPSTKGMIWKNGSINRNANPNDVKHALSLIKNSQVGLDELGSPSADDYYGNIINNMFISREDSNIDEWSPTQNQNQGLINNPAPKKNKPKFSGNEDKKTSFEEDMKEIVRKINEEE